MAYLVLAYPELRHEDFELIQDYRKNNDELYFKIVNPHFTIVFPVFDVSQDEFINEIKQNSKDINKFDFTIRCATINKDAFNDYFHAFLVPDEGYSKFVKLHDVLYSDKLKGNLRLDLDFVPHIGIGNSKNKFSCKEMVDEWNRKEFSISGKIKYLTIVNFENDTVTKLHEIELR